MTSTLHRPAAPPSANPPGPSPLAANPLAAAGAAAARAAGVGLLTVALPVLVVWASDGRAGTGTPAALRTAGLVWVAAHGVPVAVPGGRLSVLPLGLLLLPVLLLRRAGRHAAPVPPPDLRTAARLVAAVAAPYALLLAVAAGVVGTSQARPEPWAALLAGALVGGAGSAWGVLGGGRSRGLRGRPPAPLAAVLAAAAAAVAALLAAGALLAAVALAAHLGRAAELARAGEPGVVGGAALEVLGLGLVPNAVVWGASWWVGPGFGLGAGTAVGPFGTRLGDLPVLPLLAAVPGGGGAGHRLWPGCLALLVPLAAGTLAQLVLHRRGARGWRPAAAVGPGAGLLLGALAYLSGGAAGGGRLAHVGPSWWLVGAVTGLTVTAGALAAQGVRRLRTR